jgi:fumarate hydratase, class II
MSTPTRIERDSLGEVEVPEDALYGAQTQRAVMNFPISGWRLPRPMIHALGLIKANAAGVNRDLGLLPAPFADAIAEAARAVASGEHDRHFPVDVFQTGSGTSSNMNVNEVVARLATRALAQPVHPNDHVNLGQSSNDVFPTAIHVAAALQIRERLIPALDHLRTTLEAKAESLQETVTTGRTHLMDAMPLTLGQEIGGWAAQVGSGVARLEGTLPRLFRLAQGGTAVGTGVNAHPDFARRFAGAIAAETGLPFQPAGSFFEALSSQDTAVEASGQLRVVAVSLMKIANDLRWMNSGPLAGLGEITLPALQPGSSIMPGKVNPVIPEAVAMVCAQVIGNDVTIMVAGQSGNFQLNVMLPLIAHNLLQSIALLANASRLLADSAIQGFVVREENLKHKLAANPVLVTALNPVIGYERGTAIAKRAQQEGRPILDVAREMTDLPEDALRRLLDPLTLARKSGDTIPIPRK